MNEYASFIKTKFDQFKRKSAFAPLVCWPVCDDDGMIRAFLRPVTADFRITSPHYVSLFSQWRRENPTVSRGVFEITDERTERWLDNLVINRDDRILFMVVDLNGKELGHLGFSTFKYDEREAEVDYVLRGVKDTLPGLMYYAMIALMRLGLSELDLRVISLRVFADNEHAVKFYERCGFSITGRIPLYWSVLPDGEERWEEEPAHAGQEPGRFYSEMILNNAFIQSKMA